MKENVKFIMLALAFAAPIGANGAQIQTGAPAARLWASRIPTVREVVLDAENLLPENAAGLRIKDLRLKDMRKESSRLTPEELKEAQFKLKGLWLQLLKPSYYDLAEMTASQHQTRRLYAWLYGNARYSVNDDIFTISPNGENLTLEEALLQERSYALYEA
ncbi:MAG: hypothetical protein LBL99_02165 [Holosporaceae bacterium]|jgi:hypothetical protein|nr:hypothetical protein [Holosporaceae bacterium]